MKRILNGRYTAVTNESFVVFLVGMRINQFWAFHKWMPVARAMSRMLIELQKNPTKGLLSTQTRFTWREIIVTQYWDSYDQLEEYARTPGNEHLPAWKSYNKCVAAAGNSVGIWHETFLIAPKQYECVYVNMPVTGLANSKTTEVVKAIGARETSRLRLGGQGIPAVPSPTTPESL